jgi:hypothetical protein
MSPTTPPTSDAIAQAFFEMADAGGTFKQVYTSILERARKIETAREIAAQPGELPLQGDIRAQAHAWIGVTELLNELSPGWQERPGLGKDIALAAIRDLATSASSPPHVADALDGERLDYMQAHPGQFSSGTNRFHQAEGVAWFHAQGVGYFTTIREAIDAARAEAGGES